MIASIVIPTCDRDADLALCLDGLRRAGEAVAPGTVEVLVTDDGRRSTAEAMLAKDYAWVRWTAGPRRGPAANRNHGVTLAQGEWIIFIDDDCQPQPGLLQAYLKAMDRREARVLEGHTAPIGACTRLDVECPINEKGEKLWSCNMAIRRDLFLEMGGFDPHFPGPAMEDVDLQTRLHKAGEPIAFVPEARVLHPWRQRRGLTFARLSAQSTAYYLVKHPEQAKLGSWPFLVKDLARKTLFQIPQAVMRYGFRGWWNLLAETWYAPYAIRREMRRLRQKSSS